MYKDIDISKQYFQDRLKLTPEGELVWLETRPSEDFETLQAYNIYLSRDAGKKAGWVRKNHKTDNKYRIVRINGKDFRAHHIVRYLKNGRWPVMIDHIDGDGLNNHPDNLREVTNSENQRNRKMRSDNTSGHTGVWHDKKHNTWEASSRKNNKKVYLGKYKTLDEAIVARQKYLESEGDFSSRHGY